MFFVLAKLKVSRDKLNDNTKIAAIELGIIFSIGIHAGIITKEPALNGAIKPYFSGIYKNELC
jgi:hypothetical protein